MSKGQKFQARQGDVFIMTIPGNFDMTAHKKAKRENGGVVLAWGESTGHRHQIRDRNVCLLRAEGISDAVMHVGRDMAMLQHEEHATVHIPRGDYVIRIQKEYDWANEAARMVVD
jgi:hypothetical protein